jgi:hypothetical protein
MFGQQVAPKFEVEDVSDREFTRTIAQWDAKGKKLSYKEKKEKGGYMVYFPQGHSIHVRSKEEMKRLGFDRAPNLVDLESGEEMPVPQQMSLKNRVAAKTKNKASLRADSEGGDLETFEDITEGDE